MDLTDALTEQDEEALRFEEDQQHRVVDEEQKSSTTKTEALAELPEVNEESKVPVDDKVNGQIKQDEEEELRRYQQLLPGEPSGSPKTEKDHGHASAGPKHEHVPTDRNPLTHTHEAAAQDADADPAKRKADFDLRLLNTSQNKQKEDRERVLDRHPMFLPTTEKEKNLPTPAGFETDSNVKQENDPPVVSSDSIASSRAVVKNYNKTEGDSVFSSGTVNPQHVEEDQSRQSSPRNSTFGENNETSGPPVEMIAQQKKGGAHRRGPLPNSAADSALGGEISSFEKEDHDGRARAEQEKIQIPRNSTNEAFSVVVPVIKARTQDDAETSRNATRLALITTPAPAPLLAAAQDQLLLPAGAAENNTGRNASDGTYKDVASGFLQSSINDWHWLGGSWSGWSDVASSSFWKQLWREAEAALSRTGPGGATTPTAPPPPSATNTILLLDLTKTVGGGLKSTLLPNENAALVELVIDEVVSLLQLVPQ